MNAQPILGIDSARTKDCEDAEALDQRRQGITDHQKKSIFAFKERVAVSNSDRWCKTSPLKGFADLKVHGVVGECADFRRQSGELLQCRHVQMVGMKVRNPKVAARARFLKSVRIVIL